MICQLLTLLWIGTSTVLASSSSESEEKLPEKYAMLEDHYIKYYGNNPYVERYWTPLKELHSAEDTDKMKQICAEYHKLLGKGSVNTDQLVVDMNSNLLKFRKPKYRSARTDVVWYAINETGVIELEDMLHFYMTRGLGPDCVFYLTPTDDTCMEFYLQDHVCKNSASIQKLFNKKSKMKSTPQKKASKDNSNKKNENEQTSTKVYKEKSTKGANGTRTGGKVGKGSTTKTVIGNKTHASKKGESVVGKESNKKASTKKSTGIKKKGDKQNGGERKNN